MNEVVPVHQAAKPPGDAPDATKLAVADLVLDPVRRRVIRAGCELRLGGLSFDLLHSLVRHAGDVVSVDQLMNEVWRDRVVGPETVAQRIKLLRQALGDDAHNPRYIAVERGRGYRLVAPVRPVDAPVSLAARRGRAVLLMATVIAAFAWILWASSPLSTNAGIDDFEPPVNSLAVVPFRNAGTDAGHDVLAFGLAESVLHRLSGQPELLVVAATASFAEGPGNTKPRTLGRRLNVRWLLTGSVVQRADQLQVFARLIDTQDGRQVWSRQFERPVEDPFAIQAELAADVVRELHLEFVPPAAPETTSFEAELAFQRGRRGLLQRQSGSVHGAIREFEHAVALDPQFARAWLGLAEAHKVRSSLERTTVIDPGAEIEALKRALDLDPGLGEAWVLLGDLDTDPQIAEARIRKGLQLSPNSALGHEILANRLLNDQRHDDALKAIERAIALDPVTPRYPYMKALIVAQDRLDGRQAEALLRRSLELEPGFQPAWLRLAQLARLRGDLAEAVRRGEQAIRLDPDTTWVLDDMLVVYCDLGDRERAGRLAGRFGPQAQDLVLAMMNGQPEGVERALAGMTTESLEQLPPALAAQAIRLAGSIPGHQEMLLGFSDAQTLASGGRREWNLLDVSFTRIALWRETGRRVEADRLLDQVETWLRERERDAVDVHYVERPLAVVDALRGNHPQALQRLVRAFDNNVIYDGWYTLWLDPVFRPLHHDPTLHELRTAYLQRVQAERAAIDADRREGRLPVPLTSVSSGS